MDHAQHIGEAVRRHRKAQSLTLAELADAIEGYDAGNLSRFETGQQDIALSKLHAIAGALNVPLSTLFRETEPRPRGLKDAVAAMPYLSGLSAKAVKIAQAWQQLHPRDRVKVSDFIQLALLGGKDGERRD